MRRCCWRPRWPAAGRRARSSRRRCCSRVDLSTLADVADVGLGLLALGCLVWAATSQPTAHATLITTDASPPVSHRHPTRCLGALSIVGASPAGEPLAARLAPAVLSVAEASPMAVPQAELCERRVGARAVSAGRGGDGAGRVRRRADGRDGARGRGELGVRGRLPRLQRSGLLPFGRDPLADIQLYHRLLAYVALALVAWVAVEAFRTQRGVPGVAARQPGPARHHGARRARSARLRCRCSTRPLTQILHMAGAAASWSAAVVLVALRAPHGSRAVGSGCGRLTHPAPPLSRRGRGSFRQRERCRPMSS